MDFIFSVVMAVYNVERYLREAVDSLIAQDIGFDKIQLILVDDGSPDNSGAICDEYAARYPDNVLVIHKENGGVSSARNAGLVRAQGRYVNFLDSDDKLTANTLSLVNVFFEAHHDETDVVSIPIVLFDRETGDHILNYKFKSGARVIDLKAEWDAAQLHGSSAFIKREALSGLCFDVRLHYAEDAKLLQQVLVKKQTLGVVPEAHYLYRKRSDGEVSALDKSLSDPNWYLPRLTGYDQETLVSCRYLPEGIPKFIQFNVMYDLQWILLVKQLPNNIIPAEEQKVFFSLLTEVLRDIDDDVIMAQRDIKIEQKLFALGKKYGRPPEILLTGDDACFSYGDQPFYFFSSRKPWFDFLSFDADGCCVEGRFSLFPFPQSKQEFYAELDGAALPFDSVTHDKSTVSLGETILDDYLFRVRIPLHFDKKNHILRIWMKINGQPVLPREYNFGPFSGLSNWYRSAYYIRGGWCVQNRRGLVFTRAGLLEAPRRELRFLWELATARKHRARRAVLNRLAYRFLKLFKRRPLWLISDRENRANDNGEAFFRYLVQNHPEIDARFLLIKESVDYPRLVKIGPVVPADSPKRRLLALISDYSISSQVEQLNIRPYAPKDEPYRDIMADKRFVFLQHGITKDDVSGWLKKRGTNFFGFVAAARPEYESLLAPSLGYSEKNIWLTGFPRFDRLDKADNPRQITIMPTWRRYLMSGMDPRTAIWYPLPGFTESRYYHFYNDLINNERLLRAARDCGYRVAFFPHPNILPHVSLFEKNGEVELLGADTPYAKVYSVSSLVITDYSSAVFDFAYLRRPVIYAQFDRDEFFGGGHVYTEGYFDYERDGFGEVEYDLDSTVDRIIEYMENGCQMKDEYRARADRFFAFNDRNNCQRVYDKLMEAGAATDN